MATAFTGTKSGDARLLPEKRKVTEGLHAYGKAQLPLGKNEGAGPIS